MPGKIASTGKVKIQMFDGTIMILGLVRHIPDLNRNIISLCILDSKGYMYTCKDGVMKVSNGARVFVKGTKNSRLYVLECSNIIVETVAAYGMISSNSSRVGYDRVAHIDSSRSGDATEPSSESDYSSRFLA